VISQEQIQIEQIIHQLYEKTRFDKVKAFKGVAKSAFRPMQPLDFKDVALSISKEQGEHLKELIIKDGHKNIVEFGTSFGISTLFLAQGALETRGHIITTELIQSKAERAINSFKEAGVNHIIETRIGDAMETLKGHVEPIDLLLLDGWKNLYLPLFSMLEANFHTNTVIYVDNAEMAETNQFLQVVKQNSKYKLSSEGNGRVVLITIKKDNNE
tara:strand:+ start:99586 stop:100227 length:642 start_codon:yes stop_codon:yes gene_type:complete